MSIMFPYRNLLSYFEKLIKHNELFDNWNVCMIELKLFFV